MLLYLTDQFAKTSILKERKSSFKVEDNVDNGIAKRPSPPNSENTESQSFAGFPFQIPSSPSSKSAASFCPQHFVPKDKNNQCSHCVQQMKIYKMMKKQHPSLTPNHPLLGHIPRPNPNHAYPMTSSFETGAVRSSRLSSPDMVCKRASSLLPSALKRPLYNFPYLIPFNHNMAAATPERNDSSSYLNNMDANTQLLLSMYSRIMSKQISAVFPESNSTRIPSAVDTAQQDDPLDLSSGKSSDPKAMTRDSQSPVSDNSHCDEGTREILTAPSVSTASTSPPTSPLITPGSPPLQMNQLFSDSKAYSQLAYLSAAVAASKLQKLNAASSSS